MTAPKNETPEQKEIRLAHRRWKWKFSEAGKREKEYRKTQKAHMARQYEFEALAKLLSDAHNDMLVNVSWLGDLALYCYSRSAVYERIWNHATRMSRGLILDHKNKCVIATPFEKFFNYGEVHQATESIPNLPFDVFEKLDGSMICLWFYDGRWRTSTKGSFKSSQALWAQDCIDACDLRALIPGTSYVCELVGPQNRIVVRYDRPSLVILGAYDHLGLEVSYVHLEIVSGILGWPLAKKYEFASISDLLVHAKTLPSNEEGYVMRFSDGTRLKVKGDEYCRIHRLIFNCTPLAIWESMMEGDDMEKFRKELPEEFWDDFDQIHDILKDGLNSISAKVSLLAYPLADLSDKEVGLQLHTFPDDIRGFVFPYRKNNGDLLAEPVRRKLYAAVRPTANQLTGYFPSRALHMVQEESS